MVVLFNIVLKKYIVIVLNYKMRGRTNDNCDVNQEEWVRSCFKE